MKRILMAVVLLACGLAAVAQRTFDVKNQTENSQRLNTDDDQTLMDKAGVIVTCSSKKPLAFESNIDAKIEMIDKYDEDGQTLYCMLFDVSEYRTRELTIRCPGYYPYILRLRNLSKTHIYRYEIYDPNDQVDATSFQAYQELGQEFYDSCYYMEAKEKFELAARCSGVSEDQRDAALSRAEDCDSMLVWRRKALEAMDILDYETAIEFASKAMGNNPADNFMTDLSTTCTKAQSERSLKYFNAAKSLFQKKEYEDAIELYKKVEALGYDSTEAAITQRIAAERKLQRKKNAVHTIGWEFGLHNHLMGISTGSYRNHSGGYFVFKTNAALFRLMRENRLGDMAEIDMSFGWTIPMVQGRNKYFQGLYVHLGPGVAVLNKFEPNTKDNFDGKDKADVTQADIEAAMADGTSSRKLLDFHVSAAITPEIGLSLKLWRFLLRGTFQYRFALDKDYEADFKKTMGSLGVAWCF